MNVYVVLKSVPCSDDYYDDHEVVGVFTSHEAAEGAIKAQKDIRTKETSYDGSAYWTYGRGDRGRSVGAYRIEAYVLGKIRQTGRDLELSCPACGDKKRKADRICAECRRRATIYCEHGNYLHGACKHCRTLGREHNKRPWGSPREDA